MVEFLYNLVRRHMMNRRSFFSVLACSTATLACAQSTPAPTYLANQNSLDGIRVDKKTGQASFVLILDWPLDGPGTLDAAQRKLNRYYRAKRQGLHVTRYPELNPALPVGIRIFHLPAKTPFAQKVLAAIERSSRRYGFTPTLESRSSIEGPSLSRS